MAERILFVTGKLAEPALRKTLAELAPRAAIEPEVAVLGISVAALMTPDWIGRHLDVPGDVDRIMLPGWCQGDLSSLARRVNLPIELGPKDLRDLPEHFGQGARPPNDYGQYDIEIIAEINHCPRLAPEQILDQARRLRSNGADMIDVGCDPDGPWLGVGDIVRRLRDQGLRVSVDSFDAREVELAVRAGAELVLSVNSSNADQAVAWGAEVVAVPDEVATLSGLDRTVERLEGLGVRYRIDPVIEPIGIGFAASLGRYLECRRRWPRAEVLMGVGNLTELTDVDSAGVNMMLIGFCQELGIRGVLTTEVINWARSSVRELDLARRLAYYAVQHHVPPKRIDAGLVMLRDPKVHEHGPATLEEMARLITDPNFRIFAERGEIHLMNSRGYLHGSDPFILFDQLQRSNDIDPAHAFYLGYEMAKAVTALTLAKDYRQDQALDWGFLTRPESSHRSRQYKSE
jgi:dihydropteroate synthase-like protein